ncbi:MAG: hypothetical protein AAF641_17140 [Pseudomonadota bacterium]
MTDLFAYLACGFVFFSATTNTAKWFRLASLCSNICFVIYGYYHELAPILFLHGVLAPMNVMQLLRALSQDRKTGSRHVVMREGDRSYVVARKA